MTLTFTGLRPEGPGSGAALGPPPQAVRASRRTAAVRAARGLITISPGSRTQGGGGFATRLLTISATSAHHNPGPDEPVMIVDNMAHS